MTVQNSIIPAWNSYNTKPPWLTLPPGLPNDTEVFRAYTRQVLCPTLRPGDVVIMDNLHSKNSYAAPKPVPSRASSRRFSSALQTITCPRRHQLVCLMRL